MQGLGGVAIAVTIEAGRCWVAIVARARVIVGRRGQGCDIKCLAVAGLSTHRDRDIDRPRRESTGHRGYDGGIRPARHVSSNVTKVNGRAALRRAEGTARQGHACAHGSRIRAHTAQRKRRRRRFEQAKDIQGAMGANKDLAIGDGRHAKLTVASAW